MKKRSVSTFVLLVAIGFLSAYGWKTISLFSGQSRLVFNPKVEWKSTPDSSGLKYEDIRLKTEDGVHISAWFIPAKDPKGTVLLCHGNAGNVSDWIEESKVFLELGYNFFIFDYRSYGKSDPVELTEEGTYVDADTAWRYLTEERKIAGSDIIICGRSLGAAVASELAARYDSKALILQSGFTSLGDLAQEKYPFFPARWLLKFHYETLKNISKIHCPVLISHSREDTLIPFSHSQKLFRSAHEPKLFVEIKGPHHDGYLQSLEAYRSGLKKFLTEVAHAG